MVVSEDRDDGVVIGLRWCGDGRHRRQQHVDLVEQPIDPLAHVLIGALDEAALYVALAADPVCARAEVGTVLQRVVVTAILGSP